MVFKYQTYEYFVVIVCFGAVSFLIQMLILFVQSEVTFGKFGDHMDARIEPGWFYAGQTPYPMCYHSGPQTCEYYILSTLHWDSFCELKSKCEIDKGI